MERRRPLLLKFVRPTSDKREETRYEGTRLVRRKNAGQDVGGSSKARLAGRQDREYIMFL
jgi:hypothetical protein